MSKACVIILFLTFSFYGFAGNIQQSSDYHKKLAPEIDQQKFDTQFDKKDESKLFYLKAGSETYVGPNVTAAIVGLGYRQLKDSFGLNFSLNGSANIWNDKSLIAFSAKAHTLYCLNPDSDNLIYLGKGLGYLTKQEVLFTRNKDLGSFVSFESLIGVEFNKRAQSKQFIQLELSKPLKIYSKNEGLGPLRSNLMTMDRLYYFHPKKLTKDVSVSISTGIGF